MMPTIVTTHTNNHMYLVINANGHEWLGCCHLGAFVDHFSGAMPVKQGVFGHQNHFQLLKPAPLQAYHPSHVTHPPHDPTASF